MNMSILNLFQFHVVKGGVLRPRSCRNDDPAKSHAAVATGSRAGTAHDDAS